jgi:class 3 adenylate cyclase
MSGRRYQSLEDFLVANMLTIDAVLDSGWGARFPVKGREIEAAVLFADITGFSGRTAALDPTETLAFVNHFFAWISAEALRGRPGIIDKYIGDEIMIVFAREFGSEDPFADAVQAARWMAQHDAFAFMPHVGIATGEVIVGYVGTELKYNCSVFGAPVALAARCAGVKAQDDGHFSASIAFPADQWVGRDLDELLPPQRGRFPDGSEWEDPQGWALLDPVDVELKNLGAVEVRHLVHRVAHFPSQSAEDRAREGVREAAAHGRRWHRPGTEDDGAAQR